MSRLPTGPTPTPLVADLLIRHARIVTMDADRRILVDGAVAVAGDRIVAVGPDDAVAPTVRATTTRDVRGAVVHPGLIDAHVHTNSEAIRGFAPKSHGDWSELEARWYERLTPELDRASSLLSAMEMASNGTTTYCDTGGSIDLAATAGAIEEVGIRGIPGHFIGDESDEEELRTLLRSTDACLSVLSEQLGAFPFRSDGLVRCAVTMAGMGICSDELLTEGAALARAGGVPMVMHQSWSASEVAGSLRRTGRRPVEHLADLGILGPHLTLVHMIVLSPAEFELVRATGTNVVHCPSASMRRGMGALRLGRFPELLAGGTHVALGSDGISSPRDLTRQMYLAATVYREIRGDAPVITGEAALEMATIHGAAALGLADEIGSLEVGKRADIVVHRTDHPSAHPRIDDPVDAIVFLAGSRTVDSVYVDGRAIVESGSCTRVDDAAVYDAVDAAAATFQDDLGPGMFSPWPLVGRRPD